MVLPLARRKFRNLPEGESPGEGVDGVYFLKVGVYSRPYETKKAESSVTPQR